MIDSKDIEGKSIIDLGCNIGSTSFLAIEKGAKEIYGIEYDKNIATCAIRINVAFKYACEFMQYDLSKKIKFNKIFDTGFCFSIDKHINANNILAENIVKNVNNVLYYETHSNSNIPIEIMSIVKSVEYRGKVGPRKDRRFYKLIIN